MGASRLTLTVSDGWNREIYVMNVAGTGASAPQPRPQPASQSQAGGRVEDSEFNLAGGNASPDGVWSDGATVWVADYLDEKLYAYDLRSRRAA